MEKKIEDFFHTLHQTANLAHQIREKVIFADSEITWVQFHILEWLEKAGGSTQSIQEFWLCKACSPANLTRLVKLLEESGMITSKVDQKDRRKHILELTEKWRTVLNDMREELKEKVACFESLTKDIDFEQVTSDLQKVQNILLKHQHDL